MIIGGIQKNSFIDYLGKLSCVLFVSGCNFTCPYCHNPQLVRGKLAYSNRFDEKAFYEFLEKRKGFIDGVVISGGEPTLNEDLPALLENIKRLDYPVKLDTNGTRPRMIKHLIDEGLTDYIAMDIKADPFDFPPSIARNYDPHSVLSSIEIIRDSGLPYEFRTTCVKPIVNERIIRNILRTIKGAELYALQRFRTDHGVLEPRFFAKTGAGQNKDELRKLKAIADPWVQKCIVRF
jgi:pyruvate formate lyase activating enzyme